MQVTLYQVSISCIVEADNEDKALQAVANRLGSPNGRQEILTQRKDTDIYVHASLYGTADR